MPSILLDTHALLWYDQQPDRLPSKVRHALRSKAATIFVSPISLYELQRKRHSGTLPQAAHLLESIDRRMIDYDFRFLSISARHSLRAASLDWSHRDPFDRILAAQAIEEGCMLVTCDPAFTDLEGLQVLW